MSKARNDLNAAVPKFCFELEMDRRTAEGRVRTPQEFLAHYFPNDGKMSTDRIFKTLPREVRGPILTQWGVRGKRTALRDDDERVKAVVHDALLSNDLDAAMFEEALNPNIIMRWVDLSDWWSFWRGGKLSKASIWRALESGYEAALFDAEWFLSTLKKGNLSGTDVLSEGLSKEELTEWIRFIHESGDGSPKGLVGALGWDQIVHKTPDDVLIAVIDAMAIKVQLVAGKNESTTATAVPPAPAAPAPKVIVAVPTPSAPVAKTSEQPIDPQAAADLFKDSEMIALEEWAPGDARPATTPPPPTRPAPPAPPPVRPARNSGS